MPNLKLPMCSLRLRPLVPLAISWDKRLLHLATVSCWAVGDSDNSSPEPHFLQTKHPQCPQLWVNHRTYFCRPFTSPSLELLQYLNIFIEVRDPEQETGLREWPHHSWVQYQIRHSSGLCFLVSLKRKKHFLDSIVSGGNQEICFEIIFL